jgi:hypothetical protein
VAGVNDINTNEFSVGRKSSVGERPAYLPMCVWCVCVFVCVCVCMCGV